jgi:hypothetical protein
MLTLAQENILIALVEMTDTERTDLKIAGLALRAGVCQRTVKQAIKILQAKALIVCRRPCTHGLHSIYSFEVRQKAIFMANSIKHAQDYRNVPISR